YLPQFGNQAVMVPFDCIAVVAGTRQVDRHTLVCKFQDPGQTFGGGSPEARRIEVRSGAGAGAATEGFRQPCTHSPDLPVEPLQFPAAFLERIAFSFLDMPRRDLVRRERSYEGPDDGKVIVPRTATNWRAGVGL